MVNPSPVNIGGKQDRLAVPGRRASSSITLKYVITNAVSEARKKQAYQDMFERIMNNPCQNHSFPVTHLDKDYVAYRHHVTLED